LEKVGAGGLFWKQLEPPQLLLAKELSLQNGKRTKKIAMQVLNENSPISIKKSRLFYR
jgi:hypothetical protein